MMSIVHVGAVHRGVWVDSKQILVDAMEQGGRDVRFPIAAYPVSYWGDTLPQDTILWVTGEDYQTHSTWYAAVYPDGTVE